ncbi:hypothetical protein KKC00_01650 [Patescibacteria group bacterium]|nr:hypothetical protein [Patescibacteria group bacterium]
MTGKTYKNKKKISKLAAKIVAAFIFVFCLATTNFQHPLLASMMQSTNYKIQTDDSSGAGGLWSTVNYIFRDTLGEVSTGLSSTDSYKLKAGYQEMQEVYISVSVPDDISLTPSIPGISGGTSDGSVTWTVISDNSAGFNMKIKVATTPAMKLDVSYYFDDYTPGSEGVPDYDWSVASNEAEFGFTVEPETDADAVQSFLDNGSSACNEADGSQTINQCWLDFNGTTDINMINRTTRTSTSGEDEVIKFRAQSNAKFLKDGEYSAATTVTVASN